MSWQLEDSDETAPSQKERAKKAKRREACHCTKAKGKTAKEATMSRASHSQAKQGVEDQCLPQCRLRWSVGF